MSPWAGSLDLLVMAANDYAYAQEGKTSVIAVVLIRRGRGRDMLSKDVIFRAGGKSVSQQKWASMEIGK